MKTGKILDGNLEDSYIRVYISNSETNFRNRSIHKLVCFAFHGCPPNNGIKYTVDHIDRNKLNNIPDNLRWVNKIPGM